MCLYSEMYFDMDHSTDVWNSKYNNNYNEIRVFKTYRKTISQQVCFMTKICVKQSLNNTYIFIANDNLT